MDKREIDPTQMEVKGERYQNANDTLSEALDAMFARKGTVSELGGCIKEGCDIREACDEIVSEYSKAYRPGYGLCVDVLQMIAGGSGYASEVAAAALECRLRIEIETECPLEK